MSIGSILLAALGISFLIFIHELGHFLAARAFKVRVETFSLGFGPRIWGFRRGETDYRLSAVPLGGYVKMAGEYGDLRDGTVLAADDLTAKPAWQRAIIFAGGVIMNLLFAFAVFPVAFALGVPFPAPIIGLVAPGSPAWRAGLQPNDEVLAVNGHRVYQFADIGLDVALSDPEHIVLRIRRDGAEREVTLRAERSPNDDHWQIGVDLLADTRLLVVPGGAAEAAGLQSDDELVAIEGQPLEADTPPDLALARAFEPGVPVRLTVRRDGAPRDATIEPTRRVLDGPPLLGILPVDTRVLALRGDALRPGFPLRTGDTLLAVAGRMASRSDRIVRDLEAAPAGELLLHLRRDGAEIDVRLTPAERALVAEDVAFGSDESDTRVCVLPEGAMAAAGVQDGDTIVALDGTAVGTYPELRKRAQTEGPRFHVDWRTADGSMKSGDVELRPQVVRDHGVLVKPREVRHQESLLGSVRAGWDTSRNVLRTTWLTLHRLFTGDVAANTLGGIVTISYMTYQFANTGFARLLFFLGLLSINLAIINVLPIPVLDGGQLVFLLIEKIKGGRLSERFLNGAQLAGLLVIVALVLYVTYNDISRLVG